MSELMKMNLERVSPYGNFSIEPTEGREVLTVFFDFETKLLIVEELVERTEDTRLIYVTTIDAHAARVIPPDERKNFIDYAEQTETDEETGLKRTFQREINPQTGNELISEKLFELNLEISRSTRIAFSKSKPQTILDSYKQSLKHEEHEELFWRNEYAAKTLPERAAYWASAMLRQMRRLSEAGLDEYSSFTPAWYDFAKRREPKFDEILSLIFQRYRYELDYQGYSEGEIRRRIRSQNRPP